MFEKLSVEPREETGTSRMRRLRNQGFVPAVLYGHDLPNVNLSIPERDLMSVLRHSGHLVQLQGAVTDSALIKSVSWDEVQATVLHVDLTRVDASEEIELALEVELRGTAKGTTQGGVINQVTHAVEIRCPANAIPERLELRIHDLDVGQSLRAKDVPLPQGAVLLDNPEVIIVQCVTIVEEEPQAAVEGAATAEPELITRKKAEDEVPE